jgi:hypothetical protein
VYLGDGSIRGCGLPSASPSSFSVPKRTRVILRLLPVTTPTRPFRESAAYDLGEDDCIVVVPITGGVDEGECPVTCPAPERFERRQSVTKYSSSLARSHETPRGQSRSIKMR